MGATQSTAANNDFAGNIQVFERARRSRDARFDGRFFVGVKTTGIYCRPICPAVPPRRENVTFYPSAAAASEAGYRPCLRCRPECAPGTPAWGGTSTTVRRGLRLIAEGALDDGGVETLAERLGVTSRHLRRLFSRHIGASPLSVAHTQRLHFAKRLVDESTLSMRDIAAMAGYGSIRRFNDAFRAAYGRPPSALRRHRASPGAEVLTLALTHTVPFNWNRLLDYLAPRATPGVEWVDESRYVRTIGLAGEVGVIECSHDPARRSVQLSLHGSDANQLLAVVGRVRDMFDLDAPMTEILNAFEGDAVLSPHISDTDGVRLPGAWDPFELIVRTVIGQHISVTAATTIAGRIARSWGRSVVIPDTLQSRLPDDCLTHLFPTPAELADADLREAGLTRGRARTIRTLSESVMDGRIRFDPMQDITGFTDALMDIPGIGPWTAQYAAMRALKHPDAFPAGDLGLRRALRGTEWPDGPTESQLDALAARWRPWRAYAAMVLWHSGHRLKMETER